MVQTVAMNLIRPIFLGILASLLLSACSNTLANNSAADKEALARVSAGDALAFQADKDFAQGLSSREKGELTSAELQAFEFGKPGEPVKWGRSSLSASGSVVVTQPFRVGQSSCRRFSHELKKNAKTRQTNGTACRREGGAWRLVQ
ncbi:MAG: hypothetical protein ACR2O8_09050 [Rhizobiaceae bacterium]